MITILVLVAVVLQAVSPPLRSVDKGVQSGVTVGRQVVARDRGEWDAVWRQHAAGRPQPAIDFSREMVVGLFMGTRPTAGFAVEITGYRQAGADAVVQYRETVPSRDLIAAQMLTSPYHIVAIPKSSGTVTFEKLKTSS